MGRLYLVFLLAPSTRATKESLRSSVLSPKHKPYKWRYIYPRFGSSSKSYNILVHSPCSMLSLDKVRSLMLGLVCLILQFTIARGRVGQPMWRWIRTRVAATFRGPCHSALLLDSHVHHCNIHLPSTLSHKRWRTTFLNASESKFFVQVSLLHLSFADGMFHACVSHRSIHLSTISSTTSRSRVRSIGSTHLRRSCIACFGLCVVQHVGWISSRLSCSSFDKLEDQMEVVEPTVHELDHTSDAGTRGAHGCTNTNGDRRAEGSASRRMWDANGSKDRTGSCKVRASCSGSGEEDRCGSGRHGRVGTCLRFCHSKHRQDGRRLSRASRHPLPGYTNVLR